MSEQNQDLEKQAAVENVNQVIETLQKRPIPPHVFAYNLERFDPPFRMHYKPLPGQIEERFVKLYKDGAEADAGTEDVKCWKFIEVIVLEASKRLKDFNDLAEYARALWKAYGEEFNANKRLTVALTEAKTRIKEMEDQLNPTTHEPRSRTEAKRK